MSFITELYLRDKFSLTYGSEIQLPKGSKLTPAANELIKDRKIVIKLIDDKGQLYINNVKVHPLTSKNIIPENYCSLCNNNIEKKPSLLTHLDDKQLVIKNHSRIKLRGQIDLCISHTVLLQTKLNLPKLLQLFLDDIRSYLGDVLKAEVSEEGLPPPVLGNLTTDQIHKVSHYPLKYLGHDHLLSDKQHGIEISELNFLRSLIRVLEISAIETYLNKDNTKLYREDIVTGVNRLSSNVYVLMLFIKIYQQKGEEKMMEIIGAITG